MAPRQEQLSQASYPRQPRVNIAAGEDARSDSSSANHQKYLDGALSSDTHLFFPFLQFLQFLSRVNTQVFEIENEKVQTLATYDCMAPCAGLQIRSRESVHITAHIKPTLHNYLNQISRRTGGAQCDWIR